MVVLVCVWNVSVTELNKTSKASRARAVAEQWQNEQKSQITVKKDKCDAIQLKNETNKN